MNNYYQNMVNLLKSQRDKLASRYQLLGNDFKNEKEKISMLETMITGFEKFIQSGKDLEINVKKINLKGGAMGYDQFQDLVLQDMNSLSDHIQNVDKDKQFLEEKISELHDRMNTIVTQNEKLFKIKAEVEWIVNQMENVEEGAGKVEAQEFNDLYAKIKGMIDAVKTKGTINKSIADYIHKLEEYASYLENFIRTNDKTLGSIKLEKTAHMKEAVDQKSLDEVGLGSKASAMVKKVESPSTDIVPVEETTVGVAPPEESSSDSASTPVLNPNPNPNPSPSSSSGKSGDSALVGGGYRQLGGSKFAKLLGGGTFMDEYNKRSTTMIENVKNIISNNYSNVDISGKEFILELLDDKIFITDREFPLYFGKVATSLGLLIKLDDMINVYNQLYSYLKLNHSILKHDEATGVDIVELWKDVFKAKKTNFYVENLLKYPMFFYYYYPDKNTIMLEDALKNLVKDDEASKVTIKIQDVSTIKTDINQILEILDNTVICFDHIIFFIENMVLTLLQGTKDKETVPDRIAEITKSIQGLEDRIQEKKDRLLKSALINTSSVYSVLYGQTGGALDLVLPSEPLSPINEEDKGVLLELFRLYSSSILVPSGKSPMTLTNQKQIDRTIQLTYMMMSLYDKINLKLGSTDDKSMFAALTEEQKSIRKYSDFENLIKKLEEETKPEIKVEEGTKQISQITKPRLDIYKNRLILCREQLKPYIKNIAILRNLLFETKSGTFSTEETKVLIGLYNQVKRQIEDGINSYIKLIPMIFFTIEFPPSVYANQKCKYRFTFDTKNEMVEYKFIENQDKAECNNLGLGDFDEKEFVGNSFSSHAAFFESNKLNGTKKLIDDPVIGLGKLIKPDADPSKPVSATINMMFALGASGTGKTTRYFGKSNGHPDDREGIVPYIINKSLEDAKTADPDAPPTKTISIAYFVCYGQKAEINNRDANFNELIVFFDINSINDSKNDSSITEDQKYIPYYMPKSAADPSIDVNKYTNFYSTIVSKKLDKRTFSEMKGFISEGAKFPTLTPNPETQQKTFRKLLDSTPEIWKEIKPAESSSIGELFEELIIEQKKINTVLPTKNNIESSRGHTCVLVKIEDKLATTNKVKYFPLFDMAGTENTGQIDSFLTQGRDANKMAKLVQKVNTITQKKDILRAEDETKQYPSLNDLLKYDNINKWVDQTATKNKYLTIESIGGAKEKIKVEDFYQDELVKDLAAGPGINFLKKVVKEGYYINHTISMLIFAAMCVGSSLRTELITGSGKREDKFDNFFNSLFTEIDKFTCIPGPTGDAECLGKTMMLLAAKNASSIINASCIWLQILFSFLYWNEETPKSISEWLANIKSDTTDATTYLCEKEFQKSEVIPGLMTIEQLFAIDGKVEDKNDSLEKLFDLMTKVNKSYEFTSENARTIGNKVSLVSVDAGKLKVEYEKPGAIKAYSWTQGTLTIDNPDYDVSKYDAYQKAYQLRIKLGLTPAQAKNKYLIPVVPDDPGTFTEPTLGTAKSKQTARTSHAKLVTEYQKKVKELETFTTKLTPQEQKDYEAVQEATEYTVPPKINIVSKVYYDFLENKEKSESLEAFKQSLEQTLSLLEANPEYTTKFERLKKQAEKLAGTKGKPGSTNPDYKPDLHAALDDIVKKLTEGKFFVVPRKAATPTPVAKGKKPAGSAQPAPVPAEKVLPLTESIVYDVASPLGTAGEHITSYSKVAAKTDLTVGIIKGMLVDIERITEMFENKKTEDDVKRKGFKPIVNLITELEKPENIPQADLVSIIKLLEVTETKLRLDTEENKFVVVKESNGASAPIYEVIRQMNKFPVLPVCPSSTDTTQMNKLIAENQMHRIRDGRTAATKMTLMHLVTGQGVKHYMVEETIKLCKTLYESTNLDLSV